VPSRGLRTGVELLADMGVNASFPPAEIDGEKAVVHEEMRLVQDDPDKAASRRLGELAYSPHPYGRPILGTPELITALTRDPLQRYYKKYYVPSNMVLVPRPEQQATLAMAWPAAGGNDPDTYAVDLLAYILGDSPSSRLNQTVRERERLVFAIESNYVPSQLAGLVSVTARMEPGNLERAETAIRDVIRRVRDEGVTEAERERALITAESHYAFDIETAEGLARAYGQGEAVTSLADEVRYLERLRGVTAAEIQAMARKYLGDDYARVRFVPDSNRPAGGSR
jgi:zinc protease